MSTNPPSGTKTPRTDEAMALHGQSDDTLIGHEVWMIEHARALEIELAEALTSRDIFKKGFEASTQAIMAQGALLATAQRELAEAQKDRDMYKNSFEGAQRLVAEARHEIEVLRQYGNKDCTAMADAALAGRGPLP